MTITHPIRQYALIAPMAGRWPDIISTKYLSPGLKAKREVLSSQALGQRPAAESTMNCHNKTIHPPNLLLHDRTVA